VSDRNNGTVHQQRSLEVAGLTAGYGGPPIIQDINFVATAGQITAIVGPNGAGKSTLLKAVSGVVRPTSGRVLLEGRDVAGEAPEQIVRRGVSYVPQVANVFPSLSVRENLEMGGYVRRRGVKERIEALFEIFPDLRAASGRAAWALSGGQRNMLAMARGLMIDPKVMLLDEPTAGLSPRFESVVWEHILKVRDTGVATVVVEQNTRRTLTHADRAYVLTLGQNRLEGTGRELLENQEVVSLYIGRRL
jgi:ABC-type branched-subunit amino acid transport system ATPase component